MMDNDSYMRLFDAYKNMRDLEEIDAEIEALAPYVGHERKPKIYYASVLETSDHARYYYGKGYHDALNWVKGEN